MKSQVCPSVSSGPVFESLESRLMLTIDVMAWEATATFSGKMGDPCTLSLYYISNDGSSIVPANRVTIDWELHSVSDPNAAPITLAHGTYPGQLEAYDYYYYYNGYYYYYSYDYGQHDNTMTGTIPTVPPGDYYISVTLNKTKTLQETDYGNNTITLPGTYTVWYQDDHANTAAGATTVAVGGTTAGLIENIYDNDWFKVYLTAGHTYNIDALSGTVYGTSMRIYASNQTTLLNSVDGAMSGGSASMMVTPQTTGYYYFDVLPRITGYWGDYSFRVTEHATPGNVSAAGRAVYKDATGALVPLQFVEVQLYDSQGTASPVYLGSALTDANGNFLINQDDLGNPIPNIDYLPDLGTKDLYITILPSNPAADVSESYISSVLGYTWSISSTTAQNVPDGLHNFGNVQPQKASTDLTTILANLLLSRQWLEDQTTGWARDQIEVYWPDGNWTGTEPGFAWQDLLSSNILKFPRNLSSFADSRFWVAHEYGQAILDTLRGGVAVPNSAAPTGTQAPKGSGHWINSQSSPGFAFVEGWADFFGHEVFGQANMAGQDLANNSYWMGADAAKDGINHDQNTGEIVEGAVASILWDIADTTVDSDYIAGGFDNIWTIMLQDTPDSIFSNAAGANDFYHDWVALFGPSAILDDIFAQNGIAVTPDLLAPNLKPSIGTVTLSHTIIPGDKGTVAVVIRNDGMTTSTGSVTVNLYASTTPDLTGTATLIPSATTTLSINLLPGGVTVYTVNLAPDETMPLGTRYFVAEIIPGTAGMDRKAGDNVGAATSSNDWAWKFGTFDGRKNVKLTVDDLAGKPVTFTLSGLGYGEVAGGAISRDITLTGTDAKSAMTITPAAKGETTVDSITVNGSIRSITAPTTSLDGDLEVTGLLGVLSLNDVSGDVTMALNTAAGAVDPKLAVAITLDMVSDLSIDTGGIPIGALSVTQWLDTDGTVDTITAPFIKTLSAHGKKGNVKLLIADVPGDFAAALDLSGVGVTGKTATLGTATVTGNLAGDHTWDVTGNIGTMTLSGTIGAALHPWVLTGAANVTTMTVGNVTDAEVTLSGNAGTIRSVRWMDGFIQAGTIKALSATGLVSKTGPSVLGDFGADVILTTSNATALGTLTVGGWLKGSVVSAGPIGTATLGGMDGSKIWAGVKNGAPDLPTAGSNFNVLLSAKGAPVMGIGTLTIKGIVGQTDLFIDAQVAAWTMGKITLLGVKTDNTDAGGADLGIAGHSIAAYTRSLTKLSKLVGANVVENVGDFSVKLYA
jgi:hypothetical protein